MRSLTVERIAAIEALFKQGIAVKEIARILGATYGHVAFVRSRYLKHLPLRPASANKDSRRTSDEEIRAVHDLLLQGYSRREVGQKLGITRNRVIGIDHRYGLAKFHELQDHYEPCDEWRKAYASKKYAKKLGRPRKGIG